MTSANPHIRNKYSPLESMAVQALRRFGEFHPSTIDADLSVLFIEIANEVVSDWNTHPYANTGSPAVERVADYVSQTDARPIPDQVVISGLLAYYCMQQGSPKGQLYMPRYNRVLNRTLWDIISGSGPIQLHAPDGPPVNAITGMPEQ